MKKIILTISMLAISALAFAGTTYENASIYFQADNTSVNAVLNKTLCYNGEGFIARYSVCVERQRDNEGGNCLRRAKVEAYQPALSTQKTPIYEAGEGQRNIIGFEDTILSQSPLLRNVKTYREEADGSKSLISVRDIKVKSCTH